MSEQREINQNIQGTEYAATSATGNATITISNYYYREDVKLVPVESAEKDIPCPYRGLFHFGPDDAQYFFGRELFVQKLIHATQTRNFIPVLGASGSGKSSVVFAGLVPKLQQEGNWKFTHFRPGSDPFHALALALVPLYTVNLDDTDRIIQARRLANSFRNGEVPLNDVFTQIQQNHRHYRVLLIADQFEELYTFCSDETIRRQFLDCLLTSFASSPTNTNVLVATMRADFLGNALSYRPFVDVLQNADIKLGGMNRGELTQIIEKPANKLGVKFVEGLVASILDDVESEPGNLPLLEFALTLLWEKRIGKELTYAGYQEIGKVSGALVRHADEIYNKLNHQEQEQVKRIFMQLIYPGEGTQDTRRVATKAELGDTNWTLLKKLADARLVITSQNSNHQETVELVHETLIHSWDKLQEWMKIDRDFRLWQERLRIAKRQWEETNRDNGELLQGKRLVEAEIKLKERTEELREEREFIELSLKQRKRENRKKQLTNVELKLGYISSVFLVLFSLKVWQISKEIRQNLFNTLEQNQLAQKIADVKLIPRTEDYYIKYMFLYEDVIWFNRYSSQDEDNGKGLMSYNLKNKQSKNYFDNKSVTAVFVEDQDIWAGISENGKRYILHGNFEKNKLNKKQIIPVSDLISSLIEDKNKRLWVGTYSGICLIKSQQCELQEEINSSCPKLIGDLEIQVKKMVVDHKKNFLWIATNRGLIFKSLDQNKPLAKCLVDVVDDREDLTALMIDDNYQNVWVGEDNGTVKYRDINDVNNNNSEWKSHIVSTKKITSLIQISNNFFIAATTNKELFLYSMETNKWILIDLNTKEKLMIRNVVLTDSGYLFIGTNKGLYQTKLAVNLHKSYN